MRPYVLFIRADIHARRAIPAPIRTVPPRQHTAIEAQPRRRAEISLARPAVEVAAARVHAPLRDAELVAGDVGRVVGACLTVRGPALDFLGGRDRGREEYREPNGQEALW